jgi:hypothetical protein
MSMMHVGVSVAPSYIPGIVQSNEINLNTVATSRTDDHWGGLNKTLAGGFYTGVCDEIPKNSIAYDFNEMHRTGIVGGEAMNQEAVEVTTCLDLAAARGIRGGRGKCAAHVAAEHKDRQTVPELPADATWKEAEELLSKSYPFLSNATMRADSHTPLAG